MQIRSELKIGLTSSVLVALCKALTEDRASSVVELLTAVHLGTCRCGRRYPAGSTLGRWVGDWKWAQDLPTCLVCVLDWVHLTHHVTTLREGAEMSCDVCETALTGQFFTRYKRDDDSFVYACIPCLLQESGVPISKRQFGSVRTAYHKILTFQAIPERGPYVAARSPCAGCGAEDTGCADTRKRDTKYLESNGTMVHDRILCRNCGHILEEWGRR